MGLDRVQGSFTKRSGTGTQAIVISPAFTPKVIYFWGTTQTVVGQAAEAHDWYGATSGTPAAQNGSVASFDRDNMATSRARDRVAGSCVSIITGTTAATVLGEAILSSFNADGFTLNWTTSDTVAYVIYYLALGGDDITNVLVGDRNWAIVTGNNAYTGVGFQPNFIQTFGGGDSATALPDASGDYRRDYGAALSTSSRWTVAVGSDDGDTASPFPTGRRLVSTEMASKLNNFGSAVLAAADFVTFDSDGWTWNQTTAPAAVIRFFFVAFKFSNVAKNIAIGTFNACTTTNCTVDVTTGQDTTKAVLLFSRKSVPGTTIVDDGALSVGGSDFTNEGAAAIVHQETTGGNTNTNQSISSTKAIQLLNEADGALQGECDASSIANGFRTTWTTAPSIGNEVVYISFGEAAGAPPTVFPEALRQAGQIQPPRRRPRLVAYREALVET